MGRATRRGLARGAVVGLTATAIGVATIVPTSAATWSKADITGEVDHGDISQVVVKNKQRSLVVKTTFAEPGEDVGGLGILVDPGRLGFPIFIYEVEVDGTDASHRGRWTR